MRLALLLLLLSASASAQDSPFALSQSEAPRQTTASLFVDINQDGRIDLLYGDAFDNNVLLLGREAGGFLRRTLPTIGHPFTDGVFADLDNDGDQDIAVGSLNRSGLIWNRNGSFEPAPSALDLYNDARSIDVADVNGDGWLDVFLSRRFGAPNILLVRRENGTFIRKRGAHELETSTNATCWADIDRDGDTDLFVANGGGAPSELFRNDAGTLVLEARSPATTEDLPSTVCTWGDADGDGDLDLFVGNGAPTSPSHLYLWDLGELNDAPEEYFAPAELSAFGAVWGDIDNDGDLDLITASRDQSARLYRNDGDRFVEIEILPEITSSSFMVAAALADIDNDGDLDLALPAGNSNFDQPSLLLENTSEGGNWLQVHLTGVVSNRDAIGARLEAHVHIGGEARVLVREKQAHSARRSQGGPWVHFGIADAATVDSLVVVWPSGHRQSVEGPAANTFLEMTESIAVSTTPAPSSRRLDLQVSPNPSRHHVDIRVDTPKTGHLAIEVFDARGRRVWHELRFARAGDRLQFDWAAQSLPSGVYLVRAGLGDLVASRRLTLVE